MKIGKLDVIDGSRDDVLESLIRAATEGTSETKYGCFCEAHLFVQAHQNLKVLNALHEAAFVFPDGASLALGALLTGKRIQSRHPGPAIMPGLCDVGRSHGLKHYFYGGRPGIGERLADKLEELYPGIEIAGHESPPFRSLTEDEEKEVKQRIEASGAHVLWIGLGAPKQELWMQANCGRIDIPLMLGVGAAFDYIVGEQKWAPLWMRKYGLEWFYRMTTGGSRLFRRYLKYVPLSCFYLLKETYFSQLKGKQNP